MIDIPTIEDTQDAPSDPFGIGQDPATLDDAELAIAALRAALTVPLRSGVVPKDAAAIARTLLEVSGALGKHSKPPADPSAPLHEATKEELQSLAEA